MTIAPRTSQEARPTPTVVVHDWMGSNTVARIVWDEVRHRAPVPVPDRPVLNKRGELLLAVLTYAYAAGIYRSREIEEEIFRSAAGRQFFSIMPVTAQSLRHFRRQNRALIKDCLHHVLYRALKARGNHPRAIGCNAVRHDWPTVVSNSVCEPLAKAESAERLDIAATSDRLDIES